MNRIGKFITYLQEQDESMKKVWVFLLSGVSMALVVALWVVYLNLTIAKIGEPAIAIKEKQTGTQESSAQAGLLFANFKNNASAISKNFSEFIAGILNRENEIIIK
ncbi:MAG: hypothetical protein HYT12_01445 [Candidatus Liptonbacteria bacterium]|nr:hypothetical protein [Candidatus Liptonbacteria bacterium]